MEVGRQEEECIYSLSESGALKSCLLIFED